MPREAIPPSKLQKVTNGKTLKVLQEKLDSAETETINLVRQLEHIGFDCSQGDNSAKSKPLSPYVAKAGDADILQRNYETLVRRVCRNESTLQTLKLNLCNIHAQYQLRNEQVQSSKENLLSLKGSHEKEKKKLVKDLAAARKECKDNLAKRHEAQEASRRLSAALEQAVQAKAELALNYEDLRNSKQKLNKQLSETREELARELALRSSLEESHSAILERLQHLETIVQKERNEMESFSKSCAVLKDEGIKLNREKELIQNALCNSKLEITAKEKQIIKQIEEMQVFLTNLEHLKKENEALKIQLEELSKHTHSMKVALESAEKEKQGLLSRVEQSEAIQNEVVENEQKKSNDIIQNINTQLQMQIELKHQMQKESEHLKLLVEENKTRNDEQKQVLEAKIKDLEKSVHLAQEQLEANRKAKDLAIDDKQSLLDEVNLAVDGMSTEHSRMQQELEEAKLEIATITNEKSQLELEMDKLLDRISVLEQEQSTQKSVECSLAELVDSKNQLAYDKGQLQSKLLHLQQELEAVSDARSEVTHLKRTNTALQSKVKSLSSALSVVNVNQKMIEKQLKQSVVAGQEKDMKVNELMRRQDEVIEEKQRYKEQLKTLDHQQHENIQHLESKLHYAKQNNSKMAATVKSVMLSHSKLQLTLEKLQTELGKKDAEISAIEYEKKKYEESLQMLSGDMHLLQDQIVAMETNQLDRVTPLKTELEAEKTEKLNLVTSLDELQSTNQVLQSMLEKKEMELESKHHELRQLQQTRKREKEIASKNLNTLQEKIEKMELDAAVEKEKERKQAIREVNRLRQANQSTLIKITELTARCEQQHMQIQELEEKNDKQKQRILGQRTQLQQFHDKNKASQATSDRIEELSVELEELEEVRNQYMMKNSEQMQTIATFLAQISELQAEMKTVVQGQHDVEERLRKKEDQLKAEKRLRLDMTNKCRQMEEEILKLQQENEQAKEEIWTISLQARQQSMLSTQPKRHQVYTDQLLSELQKERDHSQLMDKRMKRIMNSSSRFVEDLALDLDESKVKIDE
ncbi:coiled-coil domain-containing protein 150-like isoform X2 [Anneissia japonica]|uniref:coiled-coil domain-containing protein 150-like isoform X2 n=1 Tax=Anneissia japonica TaxID=1529436 RepID=UPI0014255139|nr:coiled-coil domain-containing protein 150-like isoform X2 [Anneissia japonica]